jgi:hypothetical protein
LNAPLHCRVIGQQIVTGIKFHRRAECSVNIQQAIRQPINHFPAQKIMRLPIGSGPMQPSPKQGTIKNFWWLAHRVVMQKSLLSVHDQNMVRL